MAKLYKLFLTFITITAIVLGVSLLLLLLLSSRSSSQKISSLGGYKSLNVLGGSMHPAIKYGSIMLIKKINPENIKIGDIITFRSPIIVGSNQNQAFTTHRVRKIFKNRGNYEFETKGDANKTADVRKVKQGEVLGKVVVAVPYIGRISSITKRPMGFLLLIVIPGLLIIVIEIRNIINQLRTSRSSNA